MFSGLFLVFVNIYEPINGSLLFSQHDTNKLFIFAEQ